MEQFSAAWGVCGFADRNCGLGWSTVTMIRLAGARTREPNVGPDDSFRSAERHHLGREQY